MITVYAIHVILFMSVFIHFWGHASSWLMVVHRSYNYAHVSSTWLGVHKQIYISWRQSFFFLLISVCTICTFYVSNAAETQAIIFPCLCIFVKIGIGVQDLCGRTYWSSSFVYQIMNYFDLLLFICIYVKSPHFLCVILGRLSLLLSLNHRLELDEHTCMQASI